MNSKVATAHSTEIKSIILLVDLVGVVTGSTCLRTIKVIYPMRIVGRKQVTVRFMN